jgi:hypothetical protein
VTGYDLTVVEQAGHRTAYVLPVVPEDASTDVREGIARRRVVALTGVCPCGARAVRPSREERRAARRAGRVAWALIEHESGCPAPLDGSVTTW